MKITEIYPDVVLEDKKYEYKAKLNKDKPVNWAKTVVGYANGDGGTILVGVSNEGEAFGLTLREIDETKNLVSRINDRHIIPHAKIGYMMRSIDEDAERFVLGINVAASDSVVRYREGDFNETVYIKGDGNSTPATPEQIISLSKRKYGIDNEISDVIYDESLWTEYNKLCKKYRGDKSEPSLKQLQSEDIVSKDGYAKSGFLMFGDEYDGEDTLICARLWKGKNKTGAVLDSARFIGSLAFVFEEAISFIERNTKSGWKKAENGGRKEVRSYPKEAVREALVNAIAHRDYSITGTQIDIDIYSERMEIVSPGSWMLPRDYKEYPEGSIPSIRRNSVIAACLDVANLMERGGTGFQTMIEGYRYCDVNMQPVVSIYPGFLNLKLYDMLYEMDTSEIAYDGLTNEEKVIAILKMEGPKPVKELQEAFEYKSRSQFLNEIINPLIDAGKIYRDGNIKSPRALIKLR